MTRQPRCARVGLSRTSSQTAIKKLEDNLNLDEAYLYTDGPQAALQKALAQATEKVAVVWQMIGTTKPLTGDHLIAAEALFEGSKDVRNFLKNKIED